MAAPVQELMLMRGEQATTCLEQIVVWASSSRVLGCQYLSAFEHTHSVELGITLLPHTGLAGHQLVCWMPAHCGALDRGQ